MKFQPQCSYKCKFLYAGLYCLYREPMHVCICTTFICFYMSIEYLYLFLLEYVYEFLGHGVGNSELRW